MKNRYLSRRQFFFLSFAASLSTTLLLSAEAQTEPSLENKFSSLQSISVQPQSGSLPAGLIVCLHGSGSKAQSLISLATSIKLPNYLFIFPNAPFLDPSVPGGRVWYNLKSQHNDGIERSRQLLTSWLKSLPNTTGIPLESTILSGFSQGGAMALDVGLTLPLAGLVSLSGYLPSRPKLKVKGALPPVLMIQGRHDQIVTKGEAQQARDSLIDLGVALKYVELDIGHEIRPEVLAEMHKFISAIFNTSE